MASSYTDWRKRAVAYLGEQSRPWCLDYILCSLRHSADGARLWVEARNADFFTRSVSA